MEQAYELDFTTHSTNIIARLPRGQFERRRPQRRVDREAAHDGSRRVQGMRRRARGERPPTVVIWHEAGGVGHDIGFMYRPLLASLVAGFRSVPEDVRAAIGGRPTGITDQGLNPRLYRILGGLNPQGDFMLRGRGRRLPREAPSQLRPGDVLLWVGPHGGWEMPWPRLRSLGVKTIYYQTEPMDRCGINGSDYVLHGAKLQPDEIWGYTWHNIHYCKGDSKIVLRFVPPGYAPLSTDGVLDADEGGLPSGDALRSTNSSSELIFLGYPFFRSGRGRSYARLREKLGTQLNATFMLWNVQAFESWWRQRGQWAMHLNLHKHGNSLHQPLETLRMATLLTKGATIISERSYPQDERIYDGLIHFGSVDQIPAIRQTIHTLDQLHQGGPAVAWRVRREQIADRFRERFSPASIMQAAGAYDLLRPPPNRVAEPVVFSEKS